MKQSMSSTLPGPERTTFWQRFHRMDEVKFGLLLLSPTMLILLIFLVLPIIYAVTRSFQ